MPHSITCQPTLRTYTVIKMIIRPFELITQETLLPISHYQITRWDWGYGVCEDGIVICGQKQLHVGVM